MKLPREKQEKEIEVDRIRELEALVQAIEAARPWDDMFSKRVAFSHTFAYSSLKCQAKRWVDDAIAHQCDHRRAYWERQHWFGHVQPTSESLTLELEANRRSSRQLQAAVRARRLRWDLEKLVKSGFLPRDIECEPFLWTLPLRPVWTPAWVKCLEDLKAVDVIDPGRSYHVNCLERHRFYATRLEPKYRDKHPLPGLKAIHKRRGL